MVQHSWQLHAAAWRGDIEEATKRIRAGTDVNAMPPMKCWSPLMFAADSTRAGVEMLDLLLDSGTDANLISNPFYAKAVHRFEETALMIAAKAGNLAKVQRLVQAGADVRFQDSNGYTALMLADPKPAMIRFLIDAGADVTSLSSYAKSGIGSASAAAGGFEAVAELLKAGADVNQLRWTPLMREVAIGSVRDVARELRITFSLHDRDHYERTAWLISLKAGSQAKACLLLEAGANLNDRGFSGDTNLMLAAVGGNADLMQWLIQCGADVNAKNESDRTALMTASELGQTACVRMLIENGAEVTAQDHFGQQAINHAANSEIARLLVNAGANINWIDGTGESLLQKTAGSSDASFVRDLLNMGARVETTRTGETALHDAAREDQLAVMEILLDAGADPNALNGDDSPPLDRAWSIPAVKLLLKAGAKPELAIVWAAMYPWQDDLEVRTLLEQRL